MIFQASKYVQHLFKSFHLHGIHSPFVFQFEKKCLRDSTYYEDYELMSRFRESVKNNNTLLHIEDHGAGSRVFKSNDREVRKILQHNSSSAKMSKLLYRVARYFEVKRVLELGTSLGMATHALSIANDHVQVSSIEASKEIADFTGDNLLSHNTNNVDIIQGTFSDYFRGKLKTKPSGTYDLIYMDGHHDGEATLKYFEQLLPFTHLDTVIILDDIYWSRDMYVAWRKLTKHDRVTAAIDIYDLGFLFFRIEQRQQLFHVLV